MTTEVKTPQKTASIDGDELQELLEIEQATTASSPGSASSRAQIVHRGDAKKKGYMYLSCNVCGKGENMTINQKSCKLRKKDVDHYLCQCKIRDDEQNKKRKESAEAELLKEAKEEEQVKKFATKISSTQCRTLSAA